MGNRFVLVMFFFVGVIGCSPVSKEKPVMVIDGVTVMADEFDQAYRASLFAQYGKDGKKSFVDDLIARKLMLKAAEKMDLDKDPVFLKELQIFWEQALLKRVIDRKMKELAEQITVTDADVRVFYEQHKDKELAGKNYEEVYAQVKWWITSQKQQEAISSWAHRLNEGKQIIIDRDRLGLTPDNKE